MEVFRLSRRANAEPLSGKGRALKGARWNSIGVELIYMAKNRSLAMAEVAVHLSVATLPDDCVMSTIHIPDNVASNILINPKHRDFERMSIVKRETFPFDSRMFRIL